MKQFCWPYPWLFMLALLITVDQAESAQPTWELIPNLDAGQVTVVNSATTSTYMAPSASRSGNRVYVSTYFNTNNVPPKVIVSNIAYAQNVPANASVQVGFRIIINVITRHNFTYSVTNFGVLCFNLRYLYLAVAHEPNYFTDAKYLNFTDNNLFIGNSSQRNQKMYYWNPDNLTNSNYNNSDVQIIAFLMGFRMNCSNSKSYVSINATVFNETHYYVDMATIDRNTISQLDFSILMFNRTAIMVNYVNYVDLYISNVVGSTLYAITPAAPANQYLFRNQIGGATHVEFNLSTALGYVGFYYTTSTANDSFIVWKNFLHRKRVCPANQSKYEPLNQMCWSICPNNTASDSASVCLSCHYSCLTCSLSNSSLSCLTCNSSNQRTLSNSSCPCSTGFFDNGTSTCSSCDSLCWTCDGNGRNSCLSCASGNNRVYNVSLKECLCDLGFYENSTCYMCSSKATGCLTCLYSLSLDNFTCLSCNNSLFRVLSNDTKSCECLFGYYQNLNTCYKCVSLGCLSCSYSLSSSSQTCLICNSANNFNLTANSSCSCKSGYILNNNTCTFIPLPVTSICGNGIIQLQQACDDNNALNQDGCSSECSIESYHTCINDHTNLTYSLCYYSRQINLQTKLIYKVPGSNSVRLQFEVKAPNCNPQYLKKYLQVTNQLKMINRGRLLLDKRILQNTWQYIPTKSINYDPSSNLLIITFQFNQTIDLSTKYIQFTPSNEHSSSFSKYFYSSPISATLLQAPYNNLATTYHSQQDFNKVAILKILFIIVLVLLWIFMIVCCIFKKGAVGVQCMLVFQLCYFGLLGLNGINQAWSVLQLFGKYSFGYNNVQIMEREEIRSLRILQIQGNLPNTLNISAIVIFALFLMVTLSKVLQKCSSASPSNQEGSAQRENSDNQNNDNNMVQDNRSKCTGLYIHSIDILASFLFLTGSILIINLSFTMSKTMIGNLIQACLYFAVSIAFWIYFMQNKQEEDFGEISFCAMLRSSQNPKLDKKIKWIIKHYYILIFSALCILSLALVFLRSIQLAIFLLIILGSVAMIIFNLKARIYRQRLNNYRFILNNVILIICMFVELIACITQSKGTQYQLLIIIFVSFALLIVFNTFFFILIMRKECRIRVESDSYAQQMKIMDTSLAKANVSIIESVKGGVTPSQSRQMTFEKRFKNSLREENSSARKNLLYDDANELKVVEQVSQNARVLRAFKNTLKTIENESHYNSSSQNNEEVVNLQNILDEIINCSSDEKAQL